MHLFINHSKKRVEGVLFLFLFFSALILTQFNALFYYNVFIPPSLPEKNQSIYLGESAKPQSSDSEYNLTLEDFTIRDPNILYFNGTYYMTGTTASDGFLGYSSLDLEHWKYEGYIYVRNASNYWAHYNFWAAEMKYYNNRFYLFFTAKSDEYHRATGVAVADSPLGPYRDFTPDPLTPLDYDCLDGHLFIHPNGSLYFFYVYEWLNDGTGALWMQEISQDLSHLIGQPVELFKGPDAPWGNRVVDGPCVILFNQTYYIFWSSFNAMNGGKYCVGYAYSENIRGPYKMADYPIFDNDGGHPTIFQYGKQMSNGYIANTSNTLITFHQPNAGPEHAVIYNLTWNTAENRWEIPRIDVASRKYAIRDFMVAGLAGALFIIGITLIAIKLRKNGRIQGSLEIPE